LHDGFEVANIVAVVVSPQRIPVALAAASLVVCNGAKVRQQRLRQGSECPRIASNAVQHDDWSGRATAPFDDAEGESVAPFQLVTALFHGCQSVRITEPAVHRAASAAGHA